MSNWLREICNKIKYFVNNLFHKNNLMLKSSESDYENNMEKAHEKNTIDIIKEDNKRNQLTEEIIEIVEKNPEALKGLSNEKLKFINDYYDEDIKRINNNISKVQNEIKDIQKIINYYNRKITVAKSNN